MPVKIIPIVEGHGEVAAVPVLLRRIAKRLNAYDVQVGKPIRCQRHKLVKAGELERAIQLAVLKGGTEGRVLLLIDADTDCPAELGPVLLARAKAARADISIGVVLAKREFEAWFLGSLESLRAEYGNPHRGGLYREPEDIPGAKEQLRDLLGIPYSEVIDQPAMAARFDMDAARERCPSFDKCWRTVKTLLSVVN
ncbi:MAG: DUF4276 family protein [Terriglobia bacterium]